MLRNIVMVADDLKMAEAGETGSCVIGTAHGQSFQTDME
ncbi:Uncharacterized protein dnm_026920 [Desulfonema magnum]|uniref:Uncharacterized protein n=1 Tax=Desulfonema magnum TaxID=45655 RepID=A0A975GNA2_9BACT|nr:Uncharacterized protein dnm_026920 [Desulfonema magnum]